MGAKKVVLVDTDILIKVFTTSCVQCFAGFRANFNESIGTYEKIYSC
jgi:hypothetical protein